MKEKVLAQASAGDDVFRILDTARTGQPFYVVTDKPKKAGRDETVESLFEDYREAVKHFAVLVERAADKVSYRYPKKG